MNKNYTPEEYEAYLKVNREHARLGGIAKFKKVGRKGMSLMRKGKKKSDKKAV